MLVLINIVSASALVLLRERLSVAFPVAMCWLITLAIVDMDVGCLLLGFMLFISILLGRFRL